MNPLVITPGIHTTQSFSLFVRQQNSSTFRNIIDESFIDFPTTQVEPVIIEQPVEEQPVYVFQKKNSLYLDNNAWLGVEMPKSIANMINTSKSLSYEIWFNSRVNGSLSDLDQTSIFSYFNWYQRVLDHDPSADSLLQQRESIQDRIEEIRYLLEWDEDERNGGGHRRPGRRSRGLPFTGGHLLTDEERIKLIDEQQYLTLRLSEIQRILEPLMIPVSQSGMRGINFMMWTKDNGGRLAHTGNIHSYPFDYSYFNQNTVTDVIPENDIWYYSYVSLAEKNTKWECNIYTYNFSTQEWNFKQQNFNAYVPNVGREGIDGWLIGDQDPPGWESGIANFYKTKMKIGPDFKGWIGGFRLWSKELSENQIKQFVTQSVIQKEQSNGLLVDLRLDEGFGSEARDYSGRAIDFRFYAGDKNIPDIDTGTDLPQWDNENLVF